MNLLKLKLARIEKGLSQEKIAKLLKMSTVSYGSKERGLTEFSRSEIENIKKILKLSEERMLEIFFNN